MHAHEFHLIGVIPSVWSSIYPLNNITSGHVITDIGRGVILDGEYFRTYDFGFTVLSRLIVVAVIFVGRIRNVVKHQLATLFAETLLCHGRGFCTAFASLLLDVGQGSAPVYDLVVCDVDTVGLVVCLAVGNGEKFEKKDRADKRITHLGNFS
jgi:hypothetical protein